MKKKLIRTMLIALGTAMCIGMSGCEDSGKKPRGPIGEAGEDDNVTPTEAEPTPTPSPDIIDPDIDVHPEEIDYKSEKDLLDFLSGQWYLADRYTGEDYGIFNIRPDGSVEYFSMDGKDACEGQMGFTNHTAKWSGGFDMYEMSFSEVPKEYNGGDDVFLTGSKGFFHIAQSRGTDYLYLEEIGNGGSELVYSVFRSPYVGSPEMSWVLHRDNEVTETGGERTDTVFYAMLWNNNDNNELLLQQMDMLRYETENEYTGFRYGSGVFEDGDHTDAVWYEVKDGADLSTVLYESAFYAAYPGRIYSVTVDSNGKVEKVAEVEHAGYGEYEVMPASQNITYSGINFSCNGIDYTLEDLGNVGNSIQDVTVMGDYAIIEAHLNPHRSIYTVYNMRLRWPTETIVGAALLFGDEIWDYFYADMNTVYGGEGNAIYEADGTEIKALSFTDDEQHIKVEYWKDDVTTVYEEIIDRPEVLNAPTFAYREFRRHQNAENWAKFMEYAPEDAVFMVMVNPPSDDVWDFYQPKKIGDGGSDVVYVIALQDETGVGFGGGESITLDKGQMTNYSLTVPEGAPEYTIYAVAPGKTGDKKAEWPVWTISGKDPINWMFATE